MKIMDNNKLGQRLKTLRMAKAKRLGRRNIPQREVAKYLNISPGTYASWETDRTRPDVGLIYKVAHYFGVSTDFLLMPDTNFPEIRGAHDDATGLAWSLRRAAQTENEHKGIRAWQLLTQGESLEMIADELEITSSAEREVERYLKDVLYTDQISIDRLPQDDELGDQVKKVFNLREVRVVSTFENSPHIFRTFLLGEMGRAYFKQVVLPNMTVGLAGGSSISRLVYSLRRGECRSIEVYPLAVSPAASEAIASLDANTIVGTLAYRHEGYGVRGYTLQYTSRQLREQTVHIRQTALTRRILIKAKSIDIGFIGLGNLKFRLAPIDLLGDLLSTWGLTREDIKRKGAVGDILYHFVDSDGHEVTPELSDFICSIELQDLQEKVQTGTPIVVIASGQEKVEITQVAIKSGYANIFIIDNQLARALLKSEDRDVSGA